MFSFGDFYDFGRKERRYSFDCSNALITRYDFLSINQHICDYKYKKMSIFFSYTSELKHGSVLVFNHGGRTLFRSSIHILTLLGIPKSDFSHTDPENCMIVSRVLHAKFEHVF